MTTSLQVDMRLVGTGCYIRFCYLVHETHGKSDYVETWDSVLSSLRLEVVSTGIDDGIDQE